MKAKMMGLLILLCGICLLLCGCQSTAPEQTADGNDGFVYPTDDKDFSTLKTPGSQEGAYTYRNFFLPAKDGISQPYVGDPMPYYEDGVYYIYYLKESGDSYNHSIYLATTRDFVTYEEKDEPIIESSRSGGQDSWIGTGSVVKVKDEYLFFYTGHASSDTYEYKEKVMVAKGSSLTDFSKVADWSLAPDADLGQKNDFRDPQAIYDPATDSITLTITAAKGNVARIIKYTLSADLQQTTYDGVILTDPTEKFWNLECSDTFKLGEQWYITYSGQDDTLWYAMADAPFGPYTTPERCEGKLFYAAQYVTDGKDAYMVGWARRSESPSSTSEVSGWGGNLLVQRLMNKENGELYLAPVDSIKAQYNARRALVIEGDSLELEAGARFQYTDVFTAYESYMLTGSFQYSGNGSFGLGFDYNGSSEKYKLITIDPSVQKLRLSFNEGASVIAESSIRIEPNKAYTFTYIQEGSVGVFYLDGMAALTVRIYGVSGKPVMLYAENNSVTFSSLREYTRQR